MLRKIIAFFTAAIIALTMLPTVSFASSWSKVIYDTDVFDYLVEKIREEESDYIAERMKLMLYGDKDLYEYGVGDDWYNTSSYLTIYDKELQESINLRSSQCYGYANLVYHKLFGRISYDSGNVEVASISRSNMSVSAFKKALDKARPGAHVRGGSSHSVVYLTKDEDDEGFYYLDAYKEGGIYQVHLTHMSYEKFVNRYPSLNFILLPENYPSFDFPEELTVKDFSYPVTKKSGAGFTPSGKIMSQHNLTEVYAKLTDSKGNILSSRKVTPDTKYWDIAWFDNALDFSDITSSGTYTYYLSATDETGAEVKIEKSFTVGSSSANATVTVSSEEMTPSVSSDKYFATVFDTVPSYSRSGDKFTEDGVINGKHVILKSLSEVTVGGTKYYKLTDGSWVKATDISPLKSLAVSNKPNKTTYYDYEKLKTDGLTLTVTLENGESFKVTDGYSVDYDKNAIGEIKVNVAYFDLSTSYSITVIETDVTVGEQYEVAEALRVRAHAGTSHEQLGTLSEGTVITVTDKFFDGEYMWGLIDYNGKEGWCALEFATYLSGSMVNEISLSSERIHVEEGTSKAFTATALPSLASNTSLTYSSSDDSIITVNSAGVITAKDAGSAVVTVTASNGVKAEISVTVTATFNYSVYLNPEFNSNSATVVGIPVEISVKAFSEKYPTASVYNADGTAASQDDIISTGTVIDFNGKKYTAIVLGDPNGDGSISSTDFLMCRKSYLGTFSLGDTGFSAADIDGDGKITSTDFMRIRKHYLKLHNIYA